jgi:protein-S-isoprenylcysteine O-methyltransferase Ste14
VSGPREGAGVVAHRTVARIAEMKWRLVGVAVVALFYVGLWVSVAAGASWLEAPLITIPVLVLLIAGGNWLQHWLGVLRRAPQFSRPGSAEGDDGDHAP